MLANREDMDEGEAEVEAEAEGDSVEMADSFEEGKGNVEVV